MGRAGRPLGLIPGLAVPPKVPVSDGRLAGGKPVTLEARPATLTVFRAVRNSKGQFSQPCSVIKTTKRPRPTDGRPRPPRRAAHLP